MKRVSQSKVKISQMNALMLEALRKRGYSNEEMIEAAQHNSFPADDSMYEFNFNELHDFYMEDESYFKQSLTEGYQMKFNTIRGIRSWIHIVFQQEPRLVLEEGQEAVHATLTKQQVEQLESVLSFGWRTEMTNSHTDEVVIKPDQHE